jgi:phage terminase large subunit GpA-like protein
MSDDRLYKLEGIIIPKKESVTSWAETHHYLKRTGSYLSYRKYPFMLAPTDSMGRLHDTFEVVIMCPAQASKTTAILNFIGWSLKYQRENGLLILDNANNAQKLAKNRIKPFLMNCCGLLDDIARQESPDKSNSAVNIALASGVNLLLGSAKSASDLCSQPCAFVMLDEVDRYVELSGEGDPVTLASARTKTYRNSMIVCTSTPTVKDDSRIMSQWKLGTAERWGVICPTCQHFFSPLWKDIDWTDSENPTTVCPTCGEVWTETDIIGMEHRYEQTNPSPIHDEYGRIMRSYAINGLLMHDQTNWKALKQLEIAAIQTSESAIQSFYNTRLGEVYERPSEMRIDPDILSRCASCRYDDQSLPSDILSIVISSDTHDDCLYLLTAGFSSDGERVYLIRYDILMGDPDDKRVWAEYDRLMCEVYKTEDGRYLRPIFACGDLGGHRSRSVALYSLRNPRFRCVRGYRAPNLGQSTCVDPLLNRVSPYKLTEGVKTTVPVQYVGVSGAKDRLNKWQRLTIAGEQHIYAPSVKKCFDLDFWKGMTVEIRDNVGRWVCPYTPSGKGHMMNEPTDLMVYAMAAFEMWKTQYYLTRKDREYFTSTGSLRDLTKEIPMDANEKPKKKAARKTKVEKPKAIDEKPKAIDEKPDKKSDVEQPKRKFKHM